MLLIVDNAVVAERLLPLIAGLRPEVVTPITTLDGLDVRRIQVLQWETSFGLRQHHRHCSGAAVHVELLEDRF